jgi:hypothetical protein
VSPERKPGDPGWKPSDEDVRAAQQRPAAGLVLRVVSVIPFVALGVLGVLSLVSWAAVFVFGVGNDNGAVWTWAQGRPLGEVIVQVALMLLLGLACLAVAVGSICATMIGVKERQPRWFWLVAQLVFGGLLILLIWGSRAHADVMQQLELTGLTFWFMFVWLAFSMTVAGLRMRRLGHDGEDGSDG